MRKILILLSGVALLGGVNFTIVQREQLLTGGRVAFLELAPVDPRSLMQGDYMALRFKVANDGFPSDKRLAPAADGHVLLALDQRGVATFRRVTNASDATAALAANELRMRYRIRNEQVKFATNAFFFQEGHADRYAGARYGEFRVDTNGDAILVALRDEKLRPLGAAHTDALPGTRAPS